MKLLVVQSNSNGILFSEGGYKMEKYQIGDLVYAKLGTLPVVGTVVNINSKIGKYLVRFSAVQQDWYTEEELTPYRQK